MTSLSEYVSQKPIKMLCVGDSGLGKTGALASLAKAGFNLKILDYDNGLGILAALLKNDPAALARVEYHTLQDTFIGVGNIIKPQGQPKAFMSGLAQLNKWKDLGRNDIIVLDTLSHMSNAALVMVLSMNNRAGLHPWQSDWGQAMDMIEGVLKILYSDSIKCHVIVNAHITYVGGELDDTTKQIVGAKPYPNTLGQKLPPKVGQYFNTMLHFDNSGFGANAKKVIRTIPVSQLGVKSEILGLPKELPLESGLADFFKAAGQLPQSGV